MNIQCQRPGGSDSSVPAEDERDPANQFSQLLLRYMQDGFSVLNLSGVALDVNPALCTMTGFPREELIGIGPPHPYWPPEELETIQSALNETLKGGGSNYELIFMRKNGERFPVIVSPFAVKDREGKTVSYAATVKDITERKQAEEALRDTNQKLHLHFEQTPIGVIELGLDFRVTRWNPAAEVIFGFTRAEAVGKIGDFIIPVSYRKNMDRIWEALIKQHEVVKNTNQNLRKDGKVILCEWHHTPLIDTHGTCTGVASLVMDITERVQAEQLLAWEKGALELIGSEQPLPSVLNGLMLGMEQHLPGALCSVLLLDTDGVHLRHGAGPSLPDAYNRKVDGVTIGPAVGSCGTAVYDRRQVIVADIARDRLWVKFRKLARSHGLAACWSTPIFGIGQIVLGTFAIYFKAPRHPTPAELEMIGRAVHVTRLAIERKRANTALHKLTKELESRVVERTAALQASEARYRATVEQIPAVTYTATIDANFTPLFVSPQIEGMLGFTPEECTTHPKIWRQQLHPEDRAQALQDVELLLQSQQPLRSEYRMFRRNGTMVWVEDFAVVVARGPGTPAVMQGVMFDVTARKQAEEALARTHRALRVLSATDQMMLRATTESQLLQESCRVAVKVGGYRMAWVAYAEHATRRSIRLVAKAGVKKSDTAMVSASRNGTKAGRCPTGVAIHTKRPYVCQDVAEDPLCATWRKKARRHGIASVLALPLVTDSECLGAFTICSEQPDAFEESEVAMLQQLANDLTFGILVLRGRVARRQLEKEVLEIGERVQRQIGRDLHDSVCQSLTGLHYLLSTVQHSLTDRSAPEAPDLARITQVAENAVQQTHELARGLLRHELGRGGIADALQELAIQTRQLYRIDCRFTERTPVRLADAHVASQLYRIAQEAVSNAARHSHGKSIRVQLSRQRGRTTLTIRDTGTGFSPKAETKNGMGRSIMQYRADMIGATLKIESARGKGTTVTCVLPGGRK